MRKGSLSLSINAIVVLILAVTLLSLGLTFINNTFGGATKELDKSLRGIGEDRKNQLMSKCTQNACLEERSLDMEASSKETTLLVIFNKFGTDVDVGIEFASDECSIIDEDSGADCSDIKLSSYKSQFVEAGKKVTVPINIQVTSSAKSTSYRYKISVSSEVVDGSQLDETLYLDVNVR